MRCCPARLIVAMTLMAAIGGEVDRASSVVQAASGLAATAVVIADGAGTRTTTPFNVASGDLLMAFIASDGPSPGAQTLTASGAGLTWSLVKRVNSQAGASEIWKASAPAALSNATVTSTQAVGGFYQSLTVVTFSGASGTGATGGASGSTGAPNVPLTTTQAGSLIYGVGNDWDHAIARTPAAGQALAHQFLPSVGDTFWVQYLTSASAAAGRALQLNDTAPTNDRWNFAAVEILPAGGPGFEVDAYNDSVTVGLAASGVYNLLISSFGWFTGAVVCNVSALPAGTTGTFEPLNGPPHPGPFALTVTTSLTAPPGTYQPKVTCTSGTLSAAKTLTLIVTGAPDFKVVVEPNSLTLTQGQRGVANFQLEALNGFAQGVNLSASGLPAATSATFTPAALIPSGAGTVQFTVGALTPPGVYPLAIVGTATDASLIRQAVFQLTVLPANPSGTWREQALVDTPAMYYGVVVGDVGNTGKSRVYASGGLGVLYEYSFDGAVWSVSRLPVGVPADEEMHNMDLGPARGDDVNRLYIAVSGGDKVYECSWLNGAWQCPIIATLAGATDIFIGDVRGDGRTRMYVTWMSGLTEFTWTGSSWTQLTISNNEGGWVHGIDVGPGRSDGINRIYTANQGNGQVYEYSWNGTAWTKLLIGSSSDSRNIEVAQGRNDGKFRVYVPSGDSNVYEFTWSGSAWQKVSLGSAGISGVKVQAIPAKARSDGLVRIYAAAADGGVYEYTWTGSAWQTIQLGVATAYMYGLAKGDGLNRGTTQIYGSSYDGNAYLFEWIPAGPPPVTVPNVIGLTEAAARTAIEDKGLTVGVVSNAPSPTVPAGSVISQDPTADTPVTPASAVNLIVSSGPPPPVPVPNVVGQTQADATTAIVNSGLTLGTVSNAASPDMPSGSVISQDPAADTPVPAGSAVDLVVSSGPPPVTVPNVVGLTETAARTAIENEGLTVGVVSNAPSSMLPAGSVISQNPAADTPVPPASAVSLVVSSGPPPPVPVPNVVGQPQAAATTAIVNSGLTLGTVSNAPSPDVPSGLVTSQDPMPDTPVPAGSAVNLVVSSGPPRVPVPNVVGLTQNAATTAIVNSGLALGIVSNAPSPTVPAGSVISQNPTANTPVPRGTTVSLVVSSGPAALGVDKVVFSDGSGTRTTPSFSTASAGEVLVAFGTSDGPVSAIQSLTISGAGLTWTLVRRGNTQRGASEIWRATATSQLTNVTVRSTQQVTGYHQSLTVVAFTGAGGIGASSVASAASGAPSVSLTTTKAGSLVYGVGNDWDRAIARVLGANQVIVHQWVDTVAGDTYWVQSRSGPIATSGTLVRINDTSPTIDRWNMASVEILVK